MRSSRRLDACRCSRGARQPSTCLRASATPSLLTVTALVTTRRCVARSRTTVYTIACGATPESELRTLGVTIDIEPAQYVPARNMFRTPTAEDIRWMDVAGWEQAKAFFESDEWRQRRARAVKRRGRGARSRSPARRAKNAPAGQTDATPAHGASADFGVLTLALGLLAAAGGALDVGSAGEHLVLLAAGLLGGSVAWRSRSLATHLWNEVRPR